MDRMMDTDDFIRKYFMGEFPVETEREKALRGIGEEYHRRCDEWDDSHLTAVFRGISVPKTREENWAMQRNVKEVLEDLYRRGYSKEEVHRSIQDVGKTGRR